MLQSVGIARVPGSVVQLPYLALVSLWLQWWIAELQARASKGGVSKGGVSLLFYPSTHLFLNSACCLVKESMLTPPLLALLQLQLSYSPAMLKSTQ